MPDHKVPSYCKHLLLLLHLGKMGTEVTENSADAETDEAMNLGMFGHQQDDDKEIEHCYLLKTCLLELVHSVEKLPD